MGTPKEPKISSKGAAVLRAFLDAYPNQLTGSEVMDQLSVASGTLYPILSRFEAAKWLSSEWEKGDPVELARPRRRYYQLTALGASKARECIEFILPGALGRA